MFHPKIIFRIIGFLLMIEAAFLSSSLAVSLYYGEHILMSYLYTLAAIVGCGTLFACIGKGKERNISRKDGYIVVALCWIIFSLFGALPFYLSGSIPSVTDSFFETMSGFSTTGATAYSMVTVLLSSSTATLHV